MKRLVMLLAAVSMAGFAMADQWDGNGAPFVSIYGSKLQSGATISRGNAPTDLASASVPFRATVNMTKGDVVALASADSTYKGSVTKSASAVDSMAIGVALNTVTAGSTVYVATSGVVRVKTTVTAAKGSRYIASGTAGAVTVAAATDLTNTPLVIIPLEAKTISGGSGYFTGLIINGF